MQKRRWIAYWVIVSVWVSTVFMPLSCTAQAETAGQRNGRNAPPETAAASMGGISDPSSGTGISGTPTPPAASASSDVETSAKPSEDPAEGTSEPSTVPSDTETPAVSTSPAITETPDISVPPAVTDTPDISTPPAISTGPAITPTVPPLRPILEPVSNATFLLGTETDKRLSMTVGSSGIFDIDRSKRSNFNSSDLDRLTRLAYQSDNPSVLQVDTSGNYVAATIGKAEVTLIGYGGNYAYYDEDGVYVDHYNRGEQKLFSKTFTIYVYPDMTAVALEKDSVTIYRVKGYYKSSSAKLAIASEYVLDESDDITYVDAVSSNKKMYVNCNVKQNVLTIQCDDAGKSDVTVTINNREYVVHLKVVLVSVSKTSMLLARHKKAQIKAKGYSGKLNWKSSNPSVASVTKKGKIRAKKEGNTIISVKIDGCKIGCVVSVVSKKKKKAIKRAIHIGKTCKYSQPKRMKKGYYDCSSLVWRSYSAAGIKVASRSSAPTAASMAQWCAGRRKLLKGGYSRKNVQKLKIKAGDLMFETGARNGRYMGIYHVEMFVGYELYGFNSKGKALVVSKWANRRDGYYAYGVGIVGRM